MEIAIIAHDRMKADMVQFLNKNKSLLSRSDIQIVATGTTGSKAENAGFKVLKMLSGPMGGDAQIAARVAEGKTQMVLFFKEGTLSLATASLVLRLVANSTIFIEASPLKDFGASDNPSILLIAEEETELSLELFNGNTVDLDVNTITLCLAIK